jgi:hypothetical protein
MFVAPAYPGCALRVWARMTSRIPLLGDTRVGADDGTLGMTTFEGVVNTATGWTTRETHLAREWGNRAAAAQHAHYYLATNLRRRNLALGIPVVILSAIVGTSLFASLAASTESFPLGMRLAVGTVSLIAAVLAAIQTFLRFAERSERHAQAADWYSAIRREIDELLALPTDKRGESKRTLDGLRKEFNKAGQTYPAIGETTWARFAPTFGVEEPVVVLEEATRERQESNY